MCRRNSILSDSVAARAGLTLVESILILSVVAATTAIVMPAVGNMVGSAKATRVQMELNAIAVGLGEYWRDIGHCAGTEAGSGSSPAGKVLVGKGEFPDVRRAGGAQGWPRAQRLLLTRYLRTSEGSPLGRWRGPYLSHNIEKDPWGRAYVVNVKSSPNAPALSGAKQPIFVLSAGPNGIIETPFEQMSSGARVSGDDSAVRLQ